MMYYTHLAFGLLIALLSLNFFNIKYALLFILIAILFSVFPDIDESKSKIGRKNKIISKVIEFVFGHRGFFHSLYIPLILFFVFYNKISNEIGIAVLSGYFSHLIADALTRSGIKPLYPLINIKINGFFKTNSFFEKIFFLILVLSDIFLLLTYI